MPVYKDVKKLKVTSIFLKVLKIADFPKLFSLINNVLNVLSMVLLPDHKTFFNFWNISQWRNHHYQGEKE